MAEVTTELLNAAKNYLDITYDDAATDAKLSGILARGMAYLDKVAGDTLDYTPEDIPRELLFDYARYARENALDKFRDNYLTELNSLSAYTSATLYLAETEGGGDDGNDIAVV